MVRNLETNFTEKEVIEAIKSCGKNKVPGPDGFMGFGRKWIKWIQACLESTSISILINGSSTDHFFLLPEMGVRQGAPLSPFLFILASEGLNYLLKVATKEKLIKGVEVGNDKVIVSHLQYADDTIIFGKWNKSEVRHVLTILKCFEDLSGLKINLNKSCAYGIGTSKSELSTLATWFRCKEVVFLTNKESFWVKIIKSIHGQNDGLGCLSNSNDPILKKLPGRIWFDIIKVEDTLTKLGCEISNAFVRVVGNSSGTKFWLDKWCGDATLKDTFPRLFRLESHKEALVSDPIIHASEPLISTGPGSLIQNGDQKVNLFHSCPY
ncbi:uncharacterized protein [Rutidosis leptorrhynchoides]|uniref:uncharacterized protein n=1 Tax=Rutidosis leptorrhynchoides TaxID=125765 RepID=UPI003A9A2955